MNQRIGSILMVALPICLMVGSVFANWGGTREGNAGGGGSSSASALASSATGADLTLTPGPLKVGLQGISTDGGVTAITSGFSSTIASGSVAYSMLTGAKHGLITGDGDYFSCDGTTCTYVGTTLTAQGFLSTGTFASSAEDGLTSKLGSSSSTIGTLGSLANRTTPVGNVGGGEDTLQTVTLAASGLTTTGHCIAFRGGGTFANNVNAKNIKLYFGTAAMASATVPINTAGNWEGTYTVCRTGTSAQRYISNIVVIDTTLNTVLAFPVTGTASETEGSSIVLKATATATTDNDVVENIGAYWIM